VHLQLKVKERTVELENQKSLFDNILTNSSNGISVSEMIRDENGEVVDVSTILANDAAVRLTGLPKDIYLSKTAKELDPNILSSPYGQTCLKTLATGEPSLIQYHLEMTGRWLELTISKMDENHLIHIFTDITPIKEAQLQLERTVEELRRSNANLEEFTYAASHDLQEPLRKISFFLSRLLSSIGQSLSEENKNTVDRIEHTTGRMRSLIDDLLAYSNTTLGITSFKEVDLMDVVKEVLEDMEVTIAEQGARIEFQQLPVVKGDQRQLRQLFQNLVSNALKYQKEGKTPHVQISARLVNGTDIEAYVPQEQKSFLFHQIQVSDNGIGFHPDDAERIFRLFQRLHGKAEYPGTGVGLAIVQKVVENHHGFIWTESKPGEGATFNVLLPAE
jgi:signal transduction histidine kinase